GALRGVAARQGVVRRDRGSRVSGAGRSGRRAAEVIARLVLSDARAAAPIERRVTPGDRPPGAAADGGGVGAAVAGDPAGFAGNRQRAAHERARTAGTFALLRALGLLGGQVRRLVLWQA